MSKFTLPQDKTLAAKLIETQSDTIKKQLDIGWIGHIFGSGNEKPGNIAGFAFILSAAMMVGVFMWGPTGQDKTAILSAAGSVFSGSIGFLFGRNATSN